MGLPEILGIVGFLMLVGWMGAKVFSRGGASASSDQVVTYRLWMLLQGAAGPEFVPCTPDDTGHGYYVRGTFFPREFCKQVKNGNGVYMMATHCSMPADGNTAHGGNYGDLVEVEQASWSAAWVDFDRARRRLNFDAVWNRGDGSMAGLKNVANGLMVVCLLLGVFQLFSIRGGLSRLADNTVVLSGQVAKFSVSAPAAAGPGVTNGTLVPDVGSPAGDK